MRHPCGDRGRPGQVAGPADAGDDAGGLDHAGEPVAAGAEVERAAEVAAFLGAGGLLSVLILVQVTLGNQLIWVYGLHTVKVVEAMRAGLV